SSVVSSSGGFVPGGMIGVRSKSKDESIRLYLGRNHYNEWNFVFVSQQPGGRGQPGRGQPGGPGGRGVQGGPGGGPGGRGRGGDGRGAQPDGGRGRGGPFGPGNNNPFPFQTLPGRGGRGGGL
ncbi:MAG TPA: hypothetical protein VEL79_21885, partial [Vicinamibacterales bacterium]|nr:hypothetical protein [Vicinamibacterales bacterium]